MNQIVKSTAGISRRQLLGGAAGMLAAASIAAPAHAVSIQPHRFRVRLEGDVNMAWVHSLVDLDVVLPPGTAARLLLRVPAETSPPHSAADRATALLYIFLAPAGIPPGVPAPDLFPVSRSLLRTECIVMSVAQAGDPDSQPRHNLVLTGKFVSNEVVSPFGLLTGRVGYAAFGFNWLSEDSDAATFKLVTAGAGGSHVTVVPEAAGELSLR